MKQNPLLGSGPLLLALSVGVMSPAIAQQADNPPDEAEAAESAPATDQATEETSGGIEEIVVTAQRREQKLQDVPISISAVTAESLGNMGIDATDDLASVSPGLVLTRQQGAVTPYLRGIGAATVTGGQESPVSLYVDGFYVPQLTAVNFSFNNIARVEVLKGPQGTLFGRNATGGLIQIITRDPSADSSLTIRGSYDNYQTPEASLYGTTGITENLAADIAIFHADQGQGFGTNLVTGADTGARRETGVRSTWLYKPGNATTVRFSVDTVDTENTIGVGRQPAPGARSVDGQGPLPDYWDIRSNYEPRYEFKGTGGGLKIAHDFDSVQLVSLTGARVGDSLSFIDQDATPIPLVNAILSDQNKTFSQELQLLSNNDGPLSWIAGLYYFTYDVDYDLTIAGNAAAAAGGRFVQSSSFDTRSYAAYAQSTYAIDDATNLTAGIRFTQDKREFEGAQANANGTGFAGTATPKQKEKEPTWRVALDHRLNEQVLAYLSYNRGFKSGVYNTTNINGAPVKSEVVDAYELGLKTDLIDRRLRLNVAGFYYDYRDLQVSVINASAVSLSNAAKAEIYGAEIELTALPTDHLDLMMGLSWLHTEYKSFPGAQISEPKPAPAGGNFVCGSGQTVANANCPESIRPILSQQNVVGNELSRAPGFTGNFSGRYSIPTGVGEFAISGSYVYTSNFYWEPDNRAEQDAYGLVNAQIEWTHRLEGLRLFVFGKNLGDEEYTQFLGGGNLGDLISPQPPRTFGFGGEVRF